MKKSLLIALVGFMFIAFASCSCGSKEYQDKKEAINKIEKAIKEAKDCDQLQDALSAGNPKDGKTPEYKDDEKMTEDEKAKIKEADKKLDELYKERKKELNCDK